MSRRSPKAKRRTSDGDRRTSNRTWIDLDVRYKTKRNKNNPEAVGAGKLLNMSSTGVLFTTEFPLTAGAKIEVAISWPAQLDGHTPLKLVITGKIIRVEEKVAAISIENYEFKTRGSAEPMK